MIMRMRAVVAVAAAGVAVVAVAGCGSSTSDSADSTVASGQCRAEVPFSGAGAKGVTADDVAAVQSVATSVKLPKGTSLVTGRLSTDSDSPRQFSVAIDLCGSALDSADGLRPVATTFAAALKKSAVADSIASLYVSSAATYTESAVENQVKVKDADFASHLWNGKPSAEAEQGQWQVVGG